MMMDDNNDGQCWHSCIPKNKVFNYVWSTVLGSTNPRFKTLAWLDDVGITVYPPEVEQFAPEKWWLEDDPFLLEGNFSGAILNFGRVTV